MSLIVLNMILIIMTLVHIAMGAAQNSVSCGLEIACGSCLQSSQCQWCQFQAPISGSTGICVVLAEGFVCTGISGAALWTEQCPSGQSTTDANFSGCSSNRLEFLCRFAKGCSWKSNECVSDGPPSGPSPQPPTSPPSAVTGDVDVCRAQDNLRDQCEAFSAAGNLDCKWECADNTCRSVSFESQGLPAPPSGSADDDPCSYLLEENCEDYNESACWECSYSKSVNKCKWDGGDWKTGLENGCTGQHGPVDANKDPCATITDGSCSRFNEAKCWECRLNKAKTACEWKGGNWKNDLQQIKQTGGCKGSTNDSDNKEHDDPCREFSKKRCKDLNKARCFKCRVNTKKGRCEWDGSNPLKDLAKIADKGCKHAEQFPKYDPCREWDRKKSSCTSFNHEFCWQCEYNTKRGRCEWDGNYASDQEKLVKNGCQATSDSYCHEFNTDPVMCVRKVGCYYNKKRDKGDRCFPVPNVVPQR